MTPAELFAALPETIRSRRELHPLGYLAGDRSLRSAYAQNLARNLTLSNSARAVLDADREQLLLPLKGIVFAESLYIDVAARPMADLDIAVLPENLDAASHLLIDVGWRRMYPERARFSARHGHDVAFTNDAHEVLELHHHLYHELRADASVDGLFERAITVDLLGKPRRVPCWDDHFFLVAVHAATHAFGESSLWALDLALLLDRVSLPAAEAEATRRNAAFAFRSALRAAHHLLPQIPSSPPSADEAIRERLLDLVLGRNRLAKVPGTIQSLLARAVLTEKPADAVREVLRKLQLRAVELTEKRR